MPLPRKPRFIGNASAASSIRWMCHGPGVHVVANVPVAGPVPPPIIVVTPDISASSICCGQMKWMCESIAAGGDDHALARDDLGRRADHDVDAGLDVRDCRPCRARDPAVLEPMSHLTMPHQSMTSALVITVSAQSVGDRAGSAPCRRGSPCRRRTSPPRRRSCRSRSTSTKRSVSASRTRSPTVGPNISA